MYYFEWHEWLQIIVYVVIIILIVAIAAAMVVSCINNASNEIYAGIIVDKYTSGGNTYYTRGHNNTIHFHKSSKAWNFVIQGTKDGETVNYRFEVTEEEYGRYKIGDYYER